MSKKMGTIIRIAAAIMCFFGLGGSIALGAVLIKMRSYGVGAVIIVLGIPLPFFLFFLALGFAEIVDAAVIYKTSMQSNIITNENLQSEIKMSVAAMGNTSEAVSTENGSGMDALATAGNVSNVPAENAEAKPAVAPVARPVVSTEPWVCPQCGSFVDYKSDVCSKCGTKKVKAQANRAPQGPTEWFCIGCGTHNEKTAKFCFKCGKPRS